MAAPSRQPADTGRKSGAMAPPLLLLSDIHLSLGSAPLLTGAELNVSAGDRLCLVGRNGSGKSTFLKVAAGLLKPDSGTCFVQPGTTVRYLPQEPDLSGHATLLDYVTAGQGPSDDPYRAAYLLEQLGLDGERAPVNLSGGEVRRAALARALAPDPDILLLDEPTNHLDLPAIEWLEAELKSMRGALVLISHDRKLLTDLSRSIVWIDGGITRRLDQGFSHFEEWRDQVLEQEERDHHKLGRKIAMEEDWLRYGVTARRKRNQKRLGDLHSLRARFRETRPGHSALKMNAADAQLSGKIVIDAETISKSFSGKPVIDHLTLRVLRGDRIGIVGRNGAGKTTLLSLLTGTLEPDTGTIKLGTNLVVETLDQRRASLDDSRTLADTLTEGRGDQVIVNGQNRHVIGYMKDFLFKPEQARTPVGVLSGGERGRLMLARALAKPCNLLVLDEPTNDLDLETLELLQEIIADHPGTVIIVSHDRDFLDRTVGSVVVAEGNGVWTEYAGGYSDMVAQRGQGVGDAPISGTTGKPAAPRTKPAQAAARAPSPKGRLSYKDQHAFDTLPAKIAALEEEIARLRGRLEDADLFRKDPATFSKTSEALATAEAALAETEERWLNIALLKEQLEQG
ncbi:ABC transporter ATP-binding protein uup [Granulibacter bethesdensis]|uniref:ABC transporter ATP-binding protein uup n=2 Tax=Granulibacter bethesdensis TaxID=364410 RepID=A0AAC9K9C6_9PROT|nr:ABC transporter ATP-binding protein uup [Granulibacter bethesdensis]APH61578.1 ABC transporter ATP-binding protein uup [Granulibacter bethesdensis]